MANRLLDYQTKPASGDSRRPTGEAFDPTGSASRPGDWTDWKNAIEESVAANPGIALGVALLAGVFLGWLIKRR